MTEATRDPHSWMYAHLKAKNPLDKDEVQTIYDYVESLGRGDDVAKQKRKHIRNLAKAVRNHLLPRELADPRVELFEALKGMKTEEWKPLFPELREDEVARWYDNWNHGKLFERLFLKECHGKDGSNPA